MSLRIDLRRDGGDVFITGGGGGGGGEYWNYRGNMLRAKCSYTVHRTCG